MPADLAIPRMTLVLRRSDAQQAELDSLTAAQQDPQSPRFHQWLTPQEFGRRFGLSENDLNRLTGWLKQNGFVVDEIPDGRWTIFFSGTVSQVEAAFHTQIRYYSVNGVRHRANATPLQMPNALLPAIDGVLGIHDFVPTPASHQRALPQLGFGGATGDHYLAATDYATIYNLNPLYSAGIDGTGQTIAIVGSCVIDPSVVHSFRALMGLPVNDPVISVYGQTPAPCSSDAVSEPYLDVEWSGAVAKNAKIILLVATDINSSASYIVNHALAPVMSTSFGYCEAVNQGGGNQFWSGLWQQAASNGITSLVSSGDSGAAGCDNQDTESTAVYGTGVNAICSTPYSVCVGGTELNDFANPAQYWSPQGNATQYIPEEAWNESGTVQGGRGLWATGGGYSIVYAKSTAPWQTGNNNAFRGVPDVSLPAAVHDGYYVCDDLADCNFSYFYTSGGTSAASPSFAGMMALVVQKTGSKQGAALPALYALSTRTDVFHDVTLGNNSVPGQPGFNAGAGWDPVTGLGSVDANSMATHWGSSSTSAPSVLFSTNTLSFGNQIVNTASAAQSFTVSNSGNAPLNIASIFLQGANTGDFPSTSTCPGVTSAGTLAAGQNCSFSVTFKPAALGARSATIAVTDNASGSPHIASITGTGIAQATPPTVATSVVSNVNGIATGSCATPPQIATFITTAPAVWIYYVLTNATVGDTYTMNWIRPDGAQYTTATANNTYGTSVCFAYFIQLAGATAANYPGSWTVQTYWNKSTSPLFTLKFSVTVPGSNVPAINSGGVVNNAGAQLTTIASNAFISIYGQNLSTSATPAGWSPVNNVLPTNTGNSQVLINGKPAYLEYVSPTLINALAPVDPTVGTVTVQVITANGASVPVNVSKAAVSPALFHFPQDNNRYAVATYDAPPGGSGNGSVAVNPAIVTGVPTRAAAAGDLYTLWATGLGPTSPAIPDGQVITDSKHLVTLPVTLVIGGQTATVAYAGLAEAGLYQLNVIVPNGVPSGDALIQLTVGGVTTPPTYIYMK